MMNLEDKIDYSDLYTQITIVGESGIYPKKDNSYIADVTENNTRYRVKFLPKSDFELLNQLKALAGLYDKAKMQPLMDAIVAYKNHYVSEAKSNASYNV